MRRCRLTPWSSSLMSCTETAITWRMWTRPSAWIMRRSRWGRPWIRMTSSSAWCRLVFIITPKRSIYITRGPAFLTFTSRMRRGQRRSSLTTSLRFSLSATPMTYMRPYLKISGHTTSQLATRTWRMTRAQWAHLCQTIT
jgi:hypothetical protein